MVDSVVRSGMAGRSRLAGPQFKRAIAHEVEKREEHRGREHQHLDEPEGVQIRSEHDRPGVEEDDLDVEDDEDHGHQVEPHRKALRRLPVGDDPALVGGELGRGRPLAGGEKARRQEGHAREEHAQHEEHHDRQVVAHDRVRFYHGTLRTSTLAFPGSAAPGPGSDGGAVTPAAALRSTR